jgi:hypothetical protein
MLALGGLMALAMIIAVSHFSPHARGSRFGRMPGICRVG